MYSICLTRLVHPIGGRFDGELSGLRRCLKNIFLAQKENV